MSRRREEATIFCVVHSSPFFFPVFSLLTHALRLFALLLLLSPPHCTRSLPRRRPPLLWYERHAVVEGDSTLENRLVEKYGFHKEEILPLKTNRPGSSRSRLYRIPARKLKRLRKGGITIVKDAPFRLFEPGIEERKESRDPSRWWAGYKDRELTEQILRHLARTYPRFTSLQVIGHSLQGHPIYALKISDHPRLEEDKPAMLFNGSHHGNEPLTIDYVLDLARYLLRATKEESEPPPGETPLTKREREELLSYIKKYELWFVPMVNPDGVHRFWNLSAQSGRKNARDTHHRGRRDPDDGVDLNRNYPFHWNSGDQRGSSGDPASVFYRGTAPASEPETRTMMRLAEQQRFVLSLSYHTFATKVLVPYTFGKAMNPFPHPLWATGKRLARAGESHRPDRKYVADRYLYPVDGTDQDWLFFRFGTAAFIVEGSYHTPLYEPWGELSIRGMRPLSLESLRLYQEGPLLSLHVQDREGHPLEATVEMPDLVFLEGEHFTTHPRKGRFDFFLPGPGKYRIRAFKRGYESAENMLECTAGVCKLILILTPDQSRQ